MAILLDDVLQGQLAAGVLERAGLTSVVDRNLVQGFGVINETLVQQAGGVADDAATIAALRTSIHVPNKDS